MAILLSVVAWLLTYLLHSTILLGGACVLCAVGVVRSNAAKDTLWKVALIGGLLTATFQLALRVEPYAGNALLTPGSESALIAVATRRTPSPVFPAAMRESAGAPAPEAARAEAPVAYRPDESPVVVVGEAPPAVTAAPSRRFRRVLNDIHVSWPAALLHLWFFGALAFGLRLLVTRARLVRQLRLRRPVEGGPLALMLDELRASAGIRRPVRLSVSDALAGPIAFGRSEIVLPERVLTHLAPPEQRAVLAHELGHLVRRDPAWLALGAAIESLFFVQPLNRLARRRLQEVAEYLCDDWAADRSGGGLVLARCLAEVATWMKGAPQVAPVAGMAENGSHLVTRVKRLLDASRPGPRGATYMWRASVGAAALALVAWAAPGVAAGDVTDAATDDPPPKRAQKAAPLEKGAPAVELAQGRDGWMSIRHEGRLLVLHRGYGVRLRGQGRIGFRQWGRAFELPDGYRVQVNGEDVTGNRVVCDRDDTVRILDEAGETAWVLEPVRMRGAPAYAERTDTLENLVRETVRRVRVRTHAGDLDVDVVRPSDVFDGSMVTVDGGSELDAMMDTLVRAWEQDPESVSRAAERLARRVERLGPGLERLVETIGQQLAPQLETLGTDVARELAPAVARLGVDLGRSIVIELGDLAGSGDSRAGRKPKHE